MTIVKKSHKLSTWQWTGEMMWELMWQDDDMTMSVASDVSSDMAPC
jgi:hypothetical protein